MEHFSSLSVLFSDNLQPFDNLFRKTFPKGLDKRQELWYSMRPSSAQTPPVSGLPGRVKHIQPNIFCGFSACGISRLHRKYRPCAWFRYFFCERLFAVFFPAIRETGALKEAVRSFSKHRKGIAARCCHRVWQAIPFPCVLFGRLGLFRPYNPTVSPRISYIPHQKTKENDDRQQKRTTASFESVPARASKRDKAGTGCWHQCAGDPRRKAAYRPACPCGQADGFRNCYANFPAVYRCVQSRRVPSMTCGTTSLCSARKYAERCKTAQTSPVN